MRFPSATDHAPSVAATSQRFSMSRYKPRLTLLLTVLLGFAACGTTEDEDEQSLADTSPSQQDGTDGNDGETEGCSDATDRFWPDTADCDPACYTLVEGLIYDEQRACYEQSTELTTPLACLRNGTSGASLSCVDVPELGKVMTTHVYFDIYEGFGTCQFEQPQGLFCTD